MLKLKIKVIKDILYYKLPLYSRIPYLIIFVILLWGVFTHIATVNLIIILFVVISYIGLAYVEKWTFDNTTNTITEAGGVFPFVKIHTYNYEDISRVDIEHFFRGETGEAETQNKKGKRRQRRAMLTLSLIEKVSGNQIKIEIIDEKSSAGRSESAAISIAQHTGLPLKQDREASKGPKMHMSDLQKNMFDPH